MSDLDRQLYFGDRAEQHSLLICLKTQHWTTEFTIGSEDALLVTFLLKRKGVFISISVEIK